MTTYKKRINFLESNEGIEAKAILEKMVEDTSYHTGSSYSANTVAHPDHKISFVEKHMNYLRDHPNTDPQQYLSNLRLMNRKH